MFHCLYLDRYSPGKFDLLKVTLVSWASITKKQQKMNFIALKILAHTAPFLINRGLKGAPKRDRGFVVTPLNLEPITSAAL